MPAFARALDLPSLSRLLMNGASSSALKLGYAAITWKGEDAQAIDDISSLGFRGIQLRTAAVKQWGDKPRDLRALLEKRGLSFVTLSSGNLSLDPSRKGAERAQHLRNAQFVRDAGGMFLQVIDERPANRTPTPDDFRRMGELLSELGREVAKLGVTLVYHNHMGALGQAPDEVAQVLAASEPRYVRFLLDIAHYQAAGGNPVEAVMRYADRIATLHLKDLERQPNTPGTSGYRFVELGRGEVDVAGVLKAIDQVKFVGWGIVELDAVTDRSLTPRACADRSKAYLTSLGYTL
jgi:inosose dehydratase